MASSGQLERGIGILTTRIGRRFVLMFCGCAFLPLLVFAWVTLSHVAAELQVQNDASLHDAAKTAGMGVAARLSRLAGDLELVRELVRQQGAGGPPPDGTELLSPLRRRFRALWVVARGQSQLWCGEGRLELPDFTPSELAHVDAGRPLLRRLDRSDRLAVFARHQPGVADAPWLVGELQTEWLWNPDELRSRGSEVAVYDGAGYLLYRSFRAEPDTGMLFESVARQPAAGTITWVVGEEPHVARYWRAFLQPQFRMDLLVVQSQPQSRALAPVRGFETRFVLTALGALLCVLVLSLVQLRRTLGPIVALGDATRRVAGGEFATRVSIQSGDEFGDLGRAFNRMTEELGDSGRRREQYERELLASRDAAMAAARAKAEFVTNVSHEFRTPMAEILGAAEILRTLGPEEQAEQQEFASIAHRGAVRLSRLVDDVLALDAAAPWELEPTDVATTLRQAVAQLAAAEQARVTLVVGDRLPGVAAVPHRLVDTWRRLLDNAIKFSAEGTPIEVRATGVEVAVHVEVRDHGFGIARADLPRLFEPFQQVGRDQLVEKAHGTGLGLAIVRSTVQRLGGRIEVDSELGSGSCFRVVLPLATAPVPAVPAVPALAVRS